MDHGLAINPGAQGLTLPHSFGVSRTRDFHPRPRNPVPYYQYLSNWLYHVGSSKGRNQGQANPVLTSTLGFPAIVAQAEASSLASIAPGCPKRGNPVTPGNGRLKSTPTAMASLRLLRPEMSYVKKAKHGTVHSLLRKET